MKPEDIALPKVYMLTIPDEWRSMRPDTRQSPLHCGLRERCSGLRLREYGHRWLQFLQKH